MELIQILGHTWYEGSCGLLAVDGRQVELQDQCFFIGGHQLEMEPTDIYFLTGLPKRGEHLTLFGTRPCGQSVDSLQLE